MYAEMSYPFYRCTSTSFFSVSRGKGNANSERREGIMAIPMRRPRCAFEAYVVASFSAGICNTDGGSDTTSSSCSSSCSRSLNTISPFNRHRLRSRFSLLFPLPPRVYVHQPPLSQSVLLVLFFLFFPLLLAGIGRMVTRRRPRRRKKKVLSGATRVCLTGNTARIESRLSSPSPPRSFVLPQMAACLCRASTPRSLLNRMPLPILFSSRVKREFLSSSSAPRHLSRGYYIIAEFW